MTATTDPSAATAPATVPPASAPDLQPGTGSGAGSGSGDPTLPRLGPVGWLRWAWRQLTSMRTALLLLLLLAVAAVPGSVLPQRRIDPGLVEQYLEENPASGPWLDRLWAFDVYSSPWFSAIYLLLFVSLVGCVLPRTRVHLRALRAAPPRTPGTLSRMTGYRTATVDATPEQVLDAARVVLRGRRYRVAAYEGRRGAGASLSAERGYLAETGNLVFHLSLLGLLLAVAVGSTIGYSGQKLVVVGDGFANAVANYDTFDRGTRTDDESLAPFSFDLERLDVAFEDQAGGAQFGAPREFTATLQVQDEPGAPPRTETVRPNQPLDVDGHRVFLVGNGYAPVLTVRDASGRVFTQAVPFLPRDGMYVSLGVLKLPDAAPQQIALQGFFLPTADVDAQGTPGSVFPDARRPALLLTAYVSRPGEDGLGLDGGAPQSAYVLDDRNLIQLRGDDGKPLQLALSPGTTVRLPGGAGTVTFEGLRRYGAFDVRYDPTKVWVLVTSVLALAGVTTSLFVRRRRVWVRASRDDDGRTVVQAAGLSRGEDAGLADEVAAVLAATVAPHPAAPDPAAPDPATPDPATPDPATPHPATIKESASSVDASSTPSKE